MLSILAGETTAAEAAPAAGVSGQAISNWKRRFIQAGRSGLDSNTEQQTSREQQLVNEIAALTSALGESYLQFQAIRSSLRARTVPGAGRRMVPSPQWRSAIAVPAVAGPGFRPGGRIVSGSPAG
ncbi:helix-turn-helix domain-containing protein [Streptomyces sp. NPDC001380]|uniref:helix-turn-helix domain-containing protein n=1 Tax=Streptomyces sp. NPDC001380 TaxID=3364566 RepID=UPI0036890F4C